MKCYLTCCFAGFIVLDENCGLIDYELFPRIKLAERLKSKANGNLTREEESLLKRAVKKHEEVVIETVIPRSKYKNLKDSSKFKFETPNRGGEFLRSNMIEILFKTGFLDSEDSEGLDTENKFLDAKKKLNAEEEFKEILHELSIELTEDKLKEASKAEDLLLIQAINSIDEVDEATGKLVERLREWYSVHFPELDRMKNHEGYVRLIAENGCRDAIIGSGDLEDVLKIERSVGAEISDSDVLVLQGFATSIRSLQESKKAITDYIDQKMEKIAPNLRDLCGSSLGAKLIAHVGGIKRLSLLPSGTVQVLGAEKALFRHLKTGERPPKHGLIFQHPAVRGAKWWIRGKVARTLASKISLAVRKDVFSGDYDPSIKEGFEEKVLEIEKSNPFPKRSSNNKKVDKKKSKKKRKKRDKYKKKISDYY